MASRYKWIGIRVKPDKLWARDWRVKRGRFFKTKKALLDWTSREISEVYKSQ